MLQPFFEWMENLGVFEPSIYLGPAFNLVHLLSMVTFIGALLIVDLRLMGFGLARQPLSQVARDAQPWLIGGLIGLTVTGIPAAMATATLQYVNSMFWLKMYLLVLGVILTFTIRRTIAMADEARGPWPKVVALVSIFLWLSVAALARLIMLLPSDIFEFITG